ncbi:hypothetical protein DYB37_002161 [Aphanomyces astaci]|uniref:WW domain-containing protein n=1 Tax=Aphanomyces astaci TaxID=112090 RepID=A0A3R7EAM5_APHAT|nr:hypothetical protein DYB35_001503 [Aphanomyces astaci]RHZ23907.1 hypothetical protein DYB37_002161 [Aphanomyces astaci]
MSPQDHRLASSSSFASSGRKSAPVAHLTLDATASSATPRQKLSPLHVEVPESPRRSSKTGMASPPQPISASPSEDVASDWMVCRTDAGDIYYYNVKRQESQWTTPQPLEIQDHPPPPPPLHAPIDYEADCLHVAVSNGDIVRVQDLIAAGIATDGLDDDGRTPLWYALEHLEIAVLLLNQGRPSKHQIVAPDMYGTTLLHVVTRQRNIEMLTLLLLQADPSDESAPFSEAMDVDARDSHQQTALHVAATFGFRKCVEMLLAHGASPAVLDENSQTPIMLATLGGHVGSVQLLQVALSALLKQTEVAVQSEPVPDATRVHQLQEQVAASAKALEEAGYVEAQRHSMEATKSLQHDVDALLSTHFPSAHLKSSTPRSSPVPTPSKDTSPGKRSRLPSSNAVTEDISYEHAWALDHHDTDPMDGQHALYHEHHQLDQHQLYPTHDFTPNQRAPNAFIDDVYILPLDTSPPRPSAARVDAVWAQFFTNAAAAASTKMDDEPSDRGLMQAVLDADMDDVQARLTNGETPNMRDSLRRTSLHLAYDSDFSGNTPLHIACFRGHVGCVKFLLESASEVHVVNADGESVVHAAASGGSLPCLRLVLEYGASPLDRNHDGETAYDMLLELDGPVAPLLDCLQEAMAPPPKHTKKTFRGTPVPWIRGTASSMFGLARVKPEHHEREEAATSPLKPPTDAEVLTTTKYHELVPPAHVTEAMQIEAPTPAVSILNLRVKTLSEKPLNIDISATASVGELKDMIKAKGEAEGKFLRLIHQGKMLNDDKAALLSCNIKQNDFIHCAMSNAPPKSLVQQMTHQQEEAALDEPTHRRGFDCLRDTLSREDVQALRLHFYPQVSTMISQSVAREGESVEDRIYRVEEEWMAAQGPQSEFGTSTSVTLEQLILTTVLVALNVRPRGGPMTIHDSAHHRIDMPDMSSVDNEGTTVDMVWGVAMGFVLGFFMLFLLWERTIPRRQKLGIVIGVAINLLLNFMQRLTPEGGVPAATSATLTTKDDVTMVFAGAAKFARYYFDREPVVVLATALGAVGVLAPLVVVPIRRSLGYPTDQYDGPIIPDSLKPKQN